MRKQEHSNALFLIDIFPQLTRDEELSWIALHPFNFYINPLYGRLTESTILPDRHAEPAAGMLRTRLV
jgi:hypothetical protein